jgi:copper chaperone CopZ
MTVEKKLIEIKFLIEDITCTGCAMDMENILLDLNGVEEASGEIEEKSIIKKVKNLGFKTKLLTA